MVNHKLNQFDAMFTRLRNELNTPRPAFWEPIEGEDLIGIVAGVERMSSRDGDPYPAVHVLQEDGNEVIVRGSRTALRTAFERLNPQMGDGIAIRYLGAKVSKRGNKFHDYEVRVLNAQATKNTSSEPQF